MEADTRGHRLDCKLALGGKFCTCDYHKMKQYKQRMDGQTWMVSIVHPDTQEDHSVWHSERGGRTALDAATSYFEDDPDDNLGAAKCREDPDLVIICVIGQELASNLKQWKVYLFAIDQDNKLVPFP